MTDFAGSVAPFLRWAGSKRKLLPALRKMWRSDFGTYIEPFVGSACLFFDVGPERAVLTDINSQLIEAYNAVKTRPHQTYRAIARISRDEKTYYKLRAQNPDELPYVERVARFIYLNRFCFNGIYRTNNSGQFNVPWGGQQSGGIPSEEAFVRCGKRLRSARIAAGDFETIVRSTVRRGDFVYLDPPYAMANQRIHTQYNAQSFGLADLDRLANSLEWIVRKGANFVLSYADCAEARRYFKGWPARTVPTTRNVAGFLDRRSQALELVISNLIEQ